MTSCLIGIISDQYCVSRPVQQQVGHHRHLKVALHAPQQRSFFMFNGPTLHTLHTRNTCTCISLLIPNPHSKKRTFLQASQKQLYPPSPATHSIPKTPPHLWRNGCHVSREIMGASEHSTRERDNLAQGLARDPVRHPGSPKKAFAALAPGSWSWVASGTAQFWNLMQERSHGALTFDFF